MENSATHEVIEGSWRQNQKRLLPLQSVYGRFGTVPAKTVRDHLKDYCSSQEGSVPWQDRMIDN